MSAIPSFSVFEQTSKSRAYGYNNADFNRYTTHCAVAIARLRKSVKLQQKGGPGNKKGKVFERKRVEDVKSVDSRHLAILLNEAERAWAASQAAKSSYSRHALAREAASRDRRLLINKLNKACQHAEALLKILRSLSLHPLQEAEAAVYHLYLKSNYHFEKAAWSQAIPYLKQAQVLLELLADKAGSQTSEAISYELLDELQPILRIAQTKANESENTTPAKIEGFGQLEEKLTAIETERSKSKMLTEVEWQNGQKIPLRNAKLAIAVSSALRVVDKPSNNGKVSMKKYDRGLAALSEAEDLARKLVDDNQIALQRAHSIRFEAASLPLTQIHQYLVYRLLVIRIQRDIQLIESTISRLNTKKNPQRSKDPLLQRSAPKAESESNGLKRRQGKIWSSVIKLYDGVVQSYGQIRELGLVEADGELSEMVENRILVARASRSYYLASVYGLLQSFDKALTLNEHASLFTRQASAGLSLETTADEGSPLDLPPFTSAQLTELDQNLTKQKTQLSKDWFLSDPDAENNDEVGLSALSLDPKKKKKGGPLVFDISFNYASEINLDAIALRSEGKRIAEAAAVPAEAKKETKVMDVDRKEELNPTPAKSRGFMSWFGRG